MSTPIKPNDTTENSNPGNITELSSRVSEELLEQANHRMLKSVHEFMVQIRGTFQTEGKKQDAAPEKEANVRIDFPMIIGLVSILATLVGGVAWINSTIDTKVRDSRQELRQDIQTMKQELSAQDRDTQASMTRLSDRNDVQFDKINDKLDLIGQKIDSKSK